MKKTLFISLFLLLFSGLVNAKDEGISFVTISTGHSWFHKYSGFSKHGMNIALNFEPSLNRYLNIDTSLALHFYLDDVIKNELAGSKKKIVFLSPQISIGPRVSLPLLNDSFFLFLGAGINFGAGINYSHETGDASADFSPGFHVKGGLYYIIGKRTGIGVNSKYTWNTVHIPHNLSLNISLNFNY
jgi:hypothetical protein